MNTIFRCIFPQGGFIRNISLTITAAILFSCASAPTIIGERQTGPEGQTGTERPSGPEHPKPTPVGKRINMRKKQEKEILRPYADVFRDVRISSGRCFSPIYDSTAADPHAGEDLRVRSEVKTDPSGGETVLHIKRVGGKMPEDENIMTAHMEPISPHKTKVTVYCPAAGCDDVFSAFFAWAEGEQRECPRLP